MHAEAIAALELEVGLGAGWTDAQLLKKREVQREIEEWKEDLTRRSVSKSTVTVSVSSECA